MKRILKTLFSRMAIVIAALALQIAWLFVMILRLGQYYAPLSLGFCLLSVAVVAWIINARGNPSIKMAWIIPIMVFPIFGGVVYLMAGGKKPRRRMRRQIESAARKIAVLDKAAQPPPPVLSGPAPALSPSVESPALAAPLSQLPRAVQAVPDSPRVPDERGLPAAPFAEPPPANAQACPVAPPRLPGADVLDEIARLDPRVAGQCRYLAAQGFAVHRHTRAEYFRLGEEQFAAMLRELEKAERFIFMEYFIIEEGRMWDSLLDILRRKARAGVDVRVIFDDVGCMNTLPFRYDRCLEEQGIRALAFNPFRPVLSAVMNNRDHRKITVIDGHTGFTGGVNLADEYINARSKYGHWKDTGVLLRGEAVWNLTRLFLEMWNAFRPTDENLDAFRPRALSDAPFADDGFVQPYGDTPLDNEVLAENVYLNIVNQARRSLDIFTPYLVIDHEMTRALCLAAGRGVRVRLILPGIHESRVLKRLAASHFPELIEGGVEIYEYEPGFIHAKSFVCDGEIATVGTINMDYRSLYLHFECGCLFYRSAVVAEIAADMEETLSRCRQLRRPQRSRLRGPLRELIDATLRLFAPLM